MPAVVENGGHHRDDLHHHLQLAQVAGVDGEPFGGGNGAQPAHQEFPPDHEHRDPGRHNRGIELHQGDKAAVTISLSASGSSSMPSVVICPRRRAR